MDLSADLHTVRSFAIALAIGALIGIEREKRKLADATPAIGGLRTFIVVSVLGAMSAWLTQALGTPWVFIATGVGVCAGIVAGYVVHAQGRPDAFGLTTEFAAMAVFMLGGAALFGFPELAVGLAIVIAAVLAYKQPLHGLVAKLGWTDIFAGLRLLIATFVVLPLLPDRTLDPWDALNPYKLWLLVILIAGLSLLGYVATRWLGAHKGTALTGVTGGLVSSTAVTLFFARRSREADSGHDADLFASAVLFAWCVMFGRVVVEVLVVHPAMLGTILGAFGAMGGVAAGLGGLYYWRAARSGPGSAQRDDEVPLTNPFSLTSAAKFAAFFAFVLVVVALAKRHLPAEGMYFVAGLAGLTDVDAITLSLAEYAKGGGDAGTAANAITVAALTNTLVKAGMVAALGGRHLRRRTLVGAGAVLAAGALAIVLT